MANTSRAFSPPSGAESTERFRVVAKVPSVEGWTKNSVYFFFTLSGMLSAERLFRRHGVEIVKKDYYSARDREWYRFYP